MRVWARRYRSMYAGDWWALKSPKRPSTNETNRKIEDGGSMANVPEDLHYSKDHEWVKVDGDQAIIGITDYAQNSLGDVVYVELPKAGEEFAANEPFGSVESVKAVSEVFTPIAGIVVKINESLADEPESVNSDSYGEGWMIRLKMSNPGEVDSLLTAAEYEDFTKAESE